VGGSPHLSDSPRVVGEAWNGLTRRRLLAGAMAATALVRAISAERCNGHSGKAGQHLQVPSSPAA
jgi:hypothetical protein